MDPAGVSGEIHARPRLLAQLYKGLAWLTLEEGTGVR
jgi:hypothetical protein